MRPQRRLAVACVTRDAGKLLGNVAPGLTNQFGSRAGGLGERDSYVERGGWLQSQLVPEPRKDPCFSRPPVRASLARQEAEERTASNRRPLRGAQLTRARRADATGRACPVAAVSGDGLGARGGGKPVPYRLALCATKSAPAQWELGLFLPREGFREGEAVLTQHGESRSGLGSACRREAVPGRRRKRRAGVGGDANVALPLRQLQPGKGGWSSAACPSPASRQLQLPLLPRPWVSTRGTPGLGVSPSLLRA